MPVWMIVLAIAVAFRDGMDAREWMGSTHPRSIKVLFSILNLGLSAVLIFLLMYYYDLAR